MANPGNKRPSGGKRAGEKRRAERAQALLLNPGMASAMAGKVESIGEPPADPREAPTYILRAQLHLARAAMLDGTMTPAARREQASRILANASKNVDSASLTAELAELYEAFRKRKDPDAAAQPRVDAPGTPQGAAH
jgi:hypothetical protein